MNDYNILFLSVGRRVELIKEFKKTANLLKIKSKLITADISVYAPAIYFSDKSYQVPKNTSSLYIKSIIDICIKENIKLVIPTIDTELKILAKFKNEIFEKTGAFVLVSDIRVISICQDKLLSQKFFESNGFSVPKLYNDFNNDLNKIKYPLIIKPSSGSSSENVFKIENSKELRFYMKKVSNPIIQKFEEGEEYSIDVFLDFFSNIITIVPRLRMETRAGEISKGKIVKDRVIIQEIKKLMKILKPIGQITVQLIKTKDGIKFIEINPRFGGGAPMSIKAGANSCKNLYRILMNDSLAYNENYKDQLIFLRYDHSVVINDGKVYDD